MKSKGNRKHCRGTYQITLYRLFFAIALAVALAICSLTGWFLNRQSQSEYRHYLEQSAVSQQNNSALSINVIINAIGSCTKGNEVTSWVDASTLPEFYYNAIAAYKKLQASTTDILQIEYQVAVAPLNPRAFHGVITNMILTGNGSVSIQSYCKDHHISETEYLKIIEYFQEHEDPIVLPRYNSETNQLEDLLYIVKNKGKIHPYLFYITIPTHSLIQDTMAKSFFFYNENGIFACSKQDKELENQAHAIYETLLSQNYTSDDSRVQEIEGNYVFVTEIPHINWKIVRQYQPLPLHVQGLLLFLVVVCICVLLALTLSYYLVQMLYHPVKELLENTIIPVKGEKTLDEFQILRSNIEKITELGNQLHETMAENDSLMSLQSYKELLFSSYVSPETLSQFEKPDASYCVAVGETFSQENEKTYQSIALQKGIAYEAASQNPNMFYINLDYNRYALILRTDSLSSACELLRSLLHRMEESELMAESDHRIVLSDLHKGLTQLHLCYQEALRILDYHFLHSKSRLITYEAISSIDAVTYSYPLQMENRLIHCALDGKQEAIEIFETIIQENIRDKDLSKETLQNLIYAFIGTISRIFQEMKTTPKDFLGKDIDFKYLYNHWNDCEVFIEIKEILESIIQTVNTRENSRDQELLDKMLGYIYQNYSDDIMLNDLADYLNISPKYCGILFKQLSDNNFKDFLNRYRIERSKEILAQNPSIKIVDLSSMVGFNSSNSFIRVFNKYVGITPKAYQERVRDNR